MKKNFAKLFITIIILNSITTPVYADILKEGSPEKEPVLKINTNIGSCASGNTYIVKAEGSEELNILSEQFAKQITEESEEYNHLTDQNYMVMELSDEQVNLLKKSDMVDSVEEDNFVTGSVTDEKKPIEEKIYEDSQWNIEMVNADIQEKSSARPIKIALIDSGVDFTDGIDVVERKNFVPGEDDVSIIYEDGTGHGTSVAGIIAASGDENENVRGIAPNVELYSAKVLDSSNCAPISRVVEGIYWAIDRGVDIINMSIGAPSSNALLEKAIKDADKAGILMIASAGNDSKKGVEYPAAYDEVMAVASVDAQAKPSDNSAMGEEIEISAPGENVVTASWLDMETIASGTSIAVPHVTAVAARLWAIDSSRSSHFIRGLLDATANSVGEEDKCGYGLVDLKYAIEQYDIYAEQYVEEKSLEENVKAVEENSADITTLDDIVVEGRWTGKYHYMMLKDEINKEMPMLKIGAIISDKEKYGLNGKEKYPCLHGNALHDGKKTNYIACYRMLTHMAAKYCRGGEYKDPGKVTGLSDADYKDLCYIVGGGLHGKDANSKKISSSWSDIFKDGPLFKCIEINNAPGKGTDKDKGLIIYGMALHTAADTFAHSVYNKNTGKKIPHTSTAGDCPYVSKDNIKDKDDSKNREQYYNSRFKCAKEIMKNLLKHIEKREGGTVNDWVFDKKYYSGTFGVLNYDEYAREADAYGVGSYSSDSHTKGMYYDKNKKIFQQMNWTIK